MYVCYGYYYIPYCIVLPVKKKNHIVRCVLSLFWGKIHDPGM